MNGWTILNNVLVLIGLVPCIGFSIHWGAMLAQRLPDRQRLALEQFARQAVQQVDQQYPTQSNPGKKALAQASVTKLFQIHKLPVPGQDAIDIAIESAVFQLPHKNTPLATNG